MMARKKLIAANWKMYKTPPEAKKFCEEFLPLVAGHTRDEIAICAPYIDISTLSCALFEKGIGIGAQDVYWEKEGAFTGEISAPMLKAIGCTHVIIGHSERRQYFGETDATVNKKLKAALDAGLVPIVCVGEELEEREAKLTNDILRRQCTGAFRDIGGDRAQSLVVAYEPVWAIGTGKTATPDMAVEAHLTIRAQAAAALGDEVARKMRILYGGSVKPENAKALMSEEEIDGALVGGASLDPKAFAAIVKH
jgi:triosephosphate isomerase (TIM)